MLASGWSAVYPCHVTPREMRSRPIGTGPFKLVEFKPNESIKVAKNPDYWKRDRPYLDGIEYTIIKNASTRVLAFIAGKFDMTTPFNLTIPLMRDIQSQAPQANCVLTPTNVSRTLIVNRDKPPFGDPDIRQALALTLDRKAFIDTINEGKADIGGAMLPPPEGIWGMPAEMLRSLPGYDPDVAKNRAEARKLMEAHGYGPGNRLKIVVSTRNIPQYRDPAVILIDQLKQIYIDGELEEIDTVNWYPRSCARTSSSGSICKRTASTIPTRHFTRTLRAARSATTPAIATASSSRNSTGSRWKRIRKSASASCGRSTRSCRRSAPAR